MILKDIICLLTQLKTLLKTFFGNGAGNDQNVFKKVNEYNNNNLRKSLHNFYLTVAYQFGIPLVVFIILFIRQTIFINFRNYKPQIINVMIYFYLMLGFSAIFLQRIILF